MRTRSPAPLVSIVSTFFNAERFFEEAIASVFAQTYPHWELLLVDDGSRDGSTAMARASAARHPERVRYFEHPGHGNCGKSTSRNVGLQHARGEYVTFLDADDVFVPEKLARQVRLMLAHPDVAMVYGRTLYWHSWTGHVKDLRRDTVSTLGLPSNRVFPAPTLLTHFLRDAGTVPCICGILVRRQVALEVQGFDETIQHLYEDQVFLAKICLAGPVLAEDGCGERYRQHPDSSSAVAIRQGAYHPFWPNPARQAFLTWLAGYVTARGVADVALHRALRKALWPFQHPWAYRLLAPIYCPGYVLLRRLRSAASVIKRRYLAGPSGMLARLFSPRVRQTALALTYRWLGPRWLGQASGVSGGNTHFGAMRRVLPISHAFGFDRGQPIDRYYIERFLAQHTADIHGRVLEIGDASYTRRFGGRRVQRSDVLHVVADHPAATIIGDLSHAAPLPAEAFDCFILTQTLHLIYEVHQAVQTVYRILKPGGVVLATVPGITQISHDQWAQDWYWSFTTLSVQRLFGDVFPPANVTIAACGNVLAAAAFLQGLSAAELRPDELEYGDVNYQLLITIRAEKPEAAL